MLEWDLERDFKARLANIKRDVRETGEALVETQRSRRKVDETMRNEPLQFRAFDARVEGLVRTGQQADRVVPAVVDEQVDPDPTDPLSPARVRRDVSAAGLSAGHRDR